MGLLLADRRFQRVDLLTKRRILELIGKSTAFGIQTFDAVMTPEPVEEINVYNIDRHYEDLRLIEMKTTKKPIQNDALEGFFFGATEREYEWLEPWATATYSRSSCSTARMTTAGRSPFC
jgi:hypothetical protein